MEEKIRFCKLSYTGVSEKETETETINLYSDLDNGDSGNFVVFEFS